MPSQYFDIKPGHSPHVLPFKSVILLFLFIIYTILVVAVFTMLVVVCWGFLQLLVLVVALVLVFIITVTTVDAVLHIIFQISAVIIIIKQINSAWFICIGLHEVSLLLHIFVFLVFVCIRGDVCLLIPKLFVTDYHCQVRTRLLVILY
jgi:hypothetical protein